MIEDEINEEWISVDINPDEMLSDVLNLKFKLVNVKIGWDDSNMKPAILHLCI